MGWLCCKDLVILILILFLFLELPWCTGRHLVAACPDLQVRNWLHWLQQNPAHGALVEIAASGNLCTLNWLCHCKRKGSSAQPAKSWISPNASAAIAMVVPLVGDVCTGNPIRVCNWPNLKFMGHPEAEVSVLFMWRLCGKHLPSKTHCDVWVILLVQSVVDKLCTPFVFACHWPSFCWHTPQLQSFYDLLFSGIIW